MSGSAQGYMRATCCYPQACDYNCSCNCPDCSLGVCGSNSACDAGYCGNCNANAYDISWPWIDSNCLSYTNCTGYGQLLCGFVLSYIYDGTMNQDLYDPEVQDCGPADACTHNIMGEMTFAAWNALGHGSSGGMDYCYAYW